jgi:hypothetical protein
MRNIFLSMVLTFVTFDRRFYGDAALIKGASDSQFSVRYDDTAGVSSQDQTADKYLHSSPKYLSTKNTGERVASPPADSAAETGTGAMPKKAGGFFQFHFKLIESLLHPFMSFLFTDPDIIKLSSKLCASTLWLFIILSALGTFGVDTKPFLSLLSISGLTLGFSAKEILANTFVGLFIVLTKPFKRGAIISVGGYRGIVQSIDVRYVKLRSMNESSEILVPLSIVYSTPIVVEKE